MAVIFSLLRTRTTWLLGAAFLGALAHCAPSYAQEGNPLPTNLVATRDDVSQKRFFWCSGVADQDDLNAYVAEGFDTLVIPLPWRAGENGALFDTSFGPQRALANEGAKRGLQILFSLPAAPEALGATRISADSPSYTALWTDWAQNVVTALGDTPNLAGWMLPDDARGLATFDDIGFQHYLSTHFASIETLNSRWGTDYTDFDSISVDDINSLVTTWKANNLRVSGSALTAPGVLDTPANPYAAFSPAALSLADYKATAWKELMSEWAATLRGADKTRPIFSGACPDYAQLLAMPEGVDVSVAGIAPSVAEPDLATHNPQGIDIARRAGTKSVVARLNITPTTTLNASTIARLLPTWVDAALAHGARGVSFDSFGALENNPVLSDAVAKVMVRLKAEPLNPDPPISSLAVLLTPLAEGATLQMGQNNEPRGLYGFGDGLVSGEPSTLVSSLRWGTAFGGVDYLSPDDLTTVDLARYSTILAPQLLDCSAETSQKLGNWMRAGGTLVSDLGLGALQNGGSAAALPPDMAALAGGIGPFDLRPVSFNFRVTSAHPLLPTWSKIFDGRPGVIISGGDGEDGSAFDGAVGFAPPAPKGVPVASYPLPRAADTNPRVALTVAPVDQGYFVFAPFRLWASWRPGQPGFDGLHGDILARGAQLAIGVDALTPYPSDAKEGSTRFPEVINRSQSVTFLNHDAVGPMKNVDLTTVSVGDWLWSNALVHLQPPSASVLNGGRPAPIFNPNELQSRSRTVSLYTISGPSQKLVCQLRPISLQNLNGGTVTSQIVTEKRGTLTLKVWGPTLSTNPLGEGMGWLPMAVDGTTSFRLNVYDSPDGYRCPPGSRHRVSISDFGTPGEGEKPVRKKNTVTTEVVTADAQGCLKLDFLSTGCDMKIEPDIGLPVKDRRAQ